MPPLPIRLRPIFIVGMPRAGTTLVEQILTADSLVSSAGEINACNGATKLYLAPCSQLGVEIFFFAPSAPGQADLLLEMRERYVEALFECGVESELVIDKLPGNFQLLGFIRIMFPDALIVHCRRAPISTCWSLYTSNFAAYAPYCAALVTLPITTVSIRSCMAHRRTCSSPRCWRCNTKTSLLIRRMSSAACFRHAIYRGTISYLHLPQNGATRNDRERRAGARPTVSFTSSRNAGSRSRHIERA